MKVSAVTLEDLQGVFAVPPLARRRDANRTLDAEENAKLAQHIVAGGITRLMWGGNAFLYHVTMPEFETLLDWLVDAPDNVWVIPSLGPSFGRAIDQARLIRARRFPAAMLLPSNDPRDALGLEAGIRNIADATGSPLILYVKEQDSLGRDRDAGLNAIQRLVDSGTVVAIKYAIVRSNPQVDPYLEGLLDRVDPKRVVSGMGERPAVVHLRQFQLPGFTTGSGCVAPSLSQSLLETCRRSDWTTAGTTRASFLPLEDVRDELGPARVLHYAVEGAGIATMGPIPPFVTELETADKSRVRRVVSELSQAESLHQRAAVVKR